MRRFVLLAAAVLGFLVALAGSGAAKPGYEQAYFDGSTVTINAIEVHQNANTLANATADFYEIVYPPIAIAQGKIPQCNPCDHQGNGITPDDFHDHVLDSIPGDPGHGEFSPLWHVFVIAPIPGKEAQYASHLPVKSEADADALLDAGLAVEIDTQFYFLCSVVNAHAAG
jgi:hypothetical protein